MLFINQSGEEKQSHALLGEGCIVTIADLTTWLKITRNYVSL